MSAQNRNLLFSTPNNAVLEVLLNHFRSGKPKAGHLAILGFGQANTGWASKVKLMNVTYSLSSSPQQLQAAYSTSSSLNISRDFSPSPQLPPMS